MGARICGDQYDMLTFVTLRDSPRPGGQIRASINPSSSCYKQSWQNSTNFVAWLPSLVTGLLAVRRDFKLPAPETAQYPGPGACTPRLRLAAGGRRMANFQA